MKKARMDNEMKKGICKRCNDEKKLNRFALCESCQDEVDYEYANLYRIKTMEH